VLPVPVSLCSDAFQTAADSRSRCRPLSWRGWAELVAFGRVVVDHIQDDLDPGCVEPRDHLFEPANAKSGTLA
jgi:hypothetical protein